SIVRGTTSEQIIEMARDSGANKVFMVSAAPEVRFPNVYGIDMPSATELIAHGRDNETICKQIGADALIFQTLPDLISAVGMGNQDISRFDTSVFNGEYVTGDIDQAYLDFLDSLRNDDSKVEREIQQDLANLELHNEGA
ncbi:amidophosphoribosyltransferase, partial [Vibrio sp. 10N.261.48.A2]